jgi:NADP-reducing hydrogenase subunit HndB
MRAEDVSTQIIIGMGTCGIAAGAREAWAAFQDELERHGLEGVQIKQTGCIGICHAEPTVEIRMAEMPATIYGNVDEETAREIVRKHILGGMMVNHHIYDRLAVDIVRH